MVGKNKRKLGCLGAAVTLAIALTSSASFAQNATANVTATNVVPGIWIDLDGCEHWVLDDGISGYMSPHLTRVVCPSVIAARHVGCCRRINSLPRTNTQFQPLDVKN